MQVTLISCPQEALSGTVLHSQTLKIKQARQSRLNVLSMLRITISGACNTLSMVGSGDTKALCALLGLIALLLAALFPVLRTAAAVVGATTAGAAFAARKGKFDALLGPFNDGVNIGTAIPSGQQLSEMFASTPQNFTFAIVSCWQGVSLLFGRFLVNLDQRQLDSQTFVSVAAEKVGPGDNDDEVNANVSDVVLVAEG